MVGSISKSFLIGANDDIPKPSNTPFRALKVWKHHPGFLQLIENWWKNSLKGNPIYQRMELVCVWKCYIKIEDGRGRGPSCFTDIWSTSRRYYAFE